MIVADRALLSNAYIRDRIEGHAEDFFKVCI